MTTFKEYSEKNLFKTNSNLKIRYADSYLIDENKRQELINSYVTIEQKTSGTKINIIKESNTGIAENDWVVKCNNRRIYPTEFNFVSSPQVKKYSKGSSQLKLIWEHLKKINKVDIPVGTDLFVEFISKNSTNSYNNLYDFVLIKAVKKSIINEGTLVSSDYIKKYAEIMNFNLPCVLFEGYLNKDFVNGIINEDLKKMYRKSNLSLDSLKDSKVLIKTISEIMLNIDSKYGNKESGIVIKYNGKILKYLNNTSLIESSPKITDIKESQIIFKAIKENSIESSLEKLSSILEEYKVDFDTKEQLHDSVKNLIIKKFSSGILILGKFKELTESQIEQIKEATIKYKTVTIGILSSSDTKGTKHSRNKIFQEHFKNIEIINSSTTDLQTILDKCQNEITEIIKLDDVVVKRIERAFGIKLINI